jgi:hypothetical protein
MTRFLLGKVQLDIVLRSSTVRAHLGGLPKTPSESYTETLATGPRTVWRLSCPLEATWNIFNPSRADTKYQHWAVIVANVDKLQFENTVRERKKKKDSKNYWGEIHEVRRVGAKSHYRFGQFMAKDFE